MDMTKWTTPAYVLTVAGLDLTGCDIYVTMKQSDTIYTFEDVTATYDGTDTVIEFTMTQEQSGAFNAALLCAVQINWVKDGSRSATDIQYMRIYDNLIDEVIA